jgi:lipoprotein-anchoring transpeptidase ErfK/SrfK
MVKKILIFAFFAFFAITSNCLLAQDSFIVISKHDMMLRRYDFKGQVLEEYPIACGRNYGNKRKRGDNKTPEGVFTVEQIQDASWWTHDFGDGKGEIKGAYGPYFVRLKTGFRGIGIHGTHAPESIGTRASEGCIRLKNENLLKLMKSIKLSMVVIITTSKQDTMVD